MMRDENGQDVELNEALSAGNQAVASRPMAIPNAPAAAVQPSYDPDAIAGAGGVAPTPGGSFDPLGAVNNFFRPDSPSAQAYRSAQGEPVIAPSATAVRTPEQASPLTKAANTVYPNADRAAADNPRYIGLAPGGTVPDAQVGDAQQVIRPVDPLAGTDARLAAAQVLQGQQQNNAALQGNANWAQAWTAQRDAETNARSAKQRSTDGADMVLAGGNKAYAGQRDR